MSEIENYIITPTVKEEINTFLYLRRKWRTVGMLMETVSKIMVGTTSLLAFSVGVYPCNSYLSYLSGSIATLSLVCLQFANYSFRESKLSTDNLNILLSKFHVPTIPNLNGSVANNSKSSPINTSELAMI